MKTFKTLLFLLVWLTLPAKGNAQEIYNFVLENATRTVNSPTSGFMQNKVATFTRTTLTYLKLTALDQLPDVSGTFLDNQAFFLSEFLNLYMRHTIHNKRISPEKRQEITALFTQASKNNPLFDETDEAETELFLREQHPMTPFSLNTDWQKAYKEIKENL